MNEFLLGAVVLLIMGACVVAVAVLVNWYIGSSNESWDAVKKSLSDYIQSTDAAQKELKTQLSVAQNAVMAEQSRYRELESAHEELQERYAKDLQSWRKYEREIEQTLGKALNYPKYKDDPMNFPNVKDDDVCTGDHVAASLAMEASDVIAKYKRLYDESQNTYTRDCEQWKKKHDELQEQYTQDVGHCRKAHDYMVERYEQQIQECKEKYDEFDRRLAAESHNWNALQGMLQDKNEECDKLQAALTTLENDYKRTCEIHQNELQEAREMRSDYRKQLCGLLACDVTTSWEGLCKHARIEVERLRRARMALNTVFEDVKFESEEEGLES